MLFLLCFSLILLFSTENIYNFVLKELIVNDSYRIIARILITLIGQSFFILIFHRSGNKIINYSIFFIAIFLILCFFIFLGLNVLKFFNLKINYLYFCYGIFISVALYMFCGFLNSRYIKITEYKIKTDKNVKYRIAFISDVHIGSLSMNEKFLQKMVDIVNSIENLDYVMLGGDIIESKLISFDSESYCKILNKINPRKGVFGVLGNHEYYTGEVYNLANYLTNECRIEILKDEYKILDGSLLLIGREDSAKYMHGNRRKKIKDIVENVDIENYYSLVLDHNPSSFRESLQNKVDLQLSGHTHNGQFFPINLIVKLIYEKAYGILNRNGKILVVSSGITAWGVPIKVLSKPEIVVINVN